MEVSSDSGFWEFHQKGVDGGPHAPCRNLGRTKHGKGRECNTIKDAVEERETTDLHAMAK